MDVSEFIYQFINSGNLCCFQFLVIMHKVTISIGIQIFECPYIFFFLGEYIELELLGQMINVCLQETDKPFFQSD